MRVYIANGHRGAAVFCAPAAIQWYRRDVREIQKTAGRHRRPAADCWGFPYAKNDKIIPNSTKLTR